MKSPFPGMDPYLERHWRDVHHRLCTYACDELQPQVRPALVARIDERLVVERFPADDRSIYPDERVVERNPGADTATMLPANSSSALLITVGEETAEGFVQIIDPSDNDRIVTVIEFLSKTNKDGREGEKQYRQKAQEAIEGGANLVEIDLLREGGWVVQLESYRVPQAHRGAPYKVCVRRASMPNRREFYPIVLEARLPEVSIPLRPTDKDASPDLQKILDRAYADGAYDAIDYTRPLSPPLPAPSADCAAGQVKERRPDPT